MADLHGGSWEDNSPSEPDPKLFATDGKAASSAPEEVSKMNNKIKHLEFTQGVINRLASDSFWMKGWCVVLVAALFILLALEGRIEFAIITLAPVIAFWGLDGYFLWQERLYRALYDHVRTLEEVEVDFSMNVSAFRTDRPRTWPIATLLANPDAPRVLRACVYTSRSAEPRALSVR